MQQSTLATICKAGSVLLLAVSIPWVVYGQMGMGGMGGGGMGGMGGGGMGGVMSSRDKLLEELTKDPVLWQRPEGEVPFWLKNGKVACDSTESVRDKLNQTEEHDFLDVSLSAFFQSLGEKTGIQFDLDTKAFEEDNLGDVTLSVKGVGPLRELLRRALEPLTLTYIVHENCVEITTAAAASSRPVIRHYDLGYIQSDSKNLASIIATIERRLSQTLGSIQQEMEASCRLDSCLLSPLQKRLIWESRSCSIDSRLNPPFNQGSQPTQCSAVAKYSCMKM